MVDVSLTPAELVRLVLPDGLPAGVGAPTLVGDALTADVDAREIPGLPAAARLAARAAGTVTVRVVVADVVAGRLTLGVTATARGLPAHRLVGLVRGTVEDAVRARLVERGVAGDAVRLEAGGAGSTGDALRVVVSTAAFLAAAPLPAHLRGLRVTALRLADGRLHVTVAAPPSPR